MHPDARRYQVAEAPAGGDGAGIAAASGVAFA